ERRWVDDNACTNNGMLFWPQNTTWNQLKNVLFFADDDGAPGVVAACNSRNVIKRSGEIVYDLAFAFISPLRAHHDHRFHAKASLHTVPFTLRKGMKISKGKQENGQ